MRKWARPERSLPGRVQRAYIAQVPEPTDTPREAIGAIRIRIVLLSGLEMILGRVHCRFPIILVLSVESCRLQGHCT